MNNLVIAVGSEKHFKQESARMAFSSIYDSVEITGDSVESGVPDQPFGVEETICGAVNRAERILARYPDSKFGIGLEGGIRYNIEDDTMLAFDVAAVSINQNGVIKTVVGVSDEIELPAEVFLSVLDGYELSTSMHRYILHTSPDVTEDDVKREGAVFYLTNGATNRTEIMRMAIDRALAQLET